MSISGLVIHLDGDDAALVRACDALRCDARLTLGPLNGRRLAAVAETDGVAADRRRWDDLRATPGVVHVDVAFVDFGGDEPVDDDPSRCRHRSSSELRS
jgi:hypothetical protein